MNQKKNKAGRPPEHGAKKERLEINTRPGLKAKLKKHKGKLSVSQFADQILSNFLKGAN